MATIFNSTPTQNGHTSTITSKLGDILKVSETKYGARDKTYTILGIELTSSTIPQIWYPGDCKNVVIQITMNCSDDINRAVFQVAHEAIHCLCLTGANNTNYLEEGLATHFSIEYTIDNGHGPWSTDNPKYEAALKQVEHLFTLDSEIIKKLRNIEPTLSLITQDLLLAANPKIPETLAENLTKKF